MMDLFEKIEILGQAAQYDICGSYLCQGKAGHRQKSPLGRWIYPAVMPDGREIRLLKVLMSNVCENDCLYCCNSCTQDFRRVSFQPEELARLFFQLWHSRRVQGLFLSSAVAGNTETVMTRMLETVEIIRWRYRFRGYIHLKILPGASFSIIEQAVRLADRVSLNLEAPNPQRLQKIAPQKQFDRDLLSRMKWIRKLADQGWRTRGGQTTQFVVGAAGESDKEILTTASSLYRDLGLRRAYFSAFQPVPGTPLENHPPTSLIREHRLYQTDFLFRQYGFSVDELIFDSQGNLPLKADPKLTWALNHPEWFPIDVNTASKEQLLRVPGIGPKSARRILKLRRQHRFRDLKDLSAVGAIASRSAQFVLLNGKRPQMSKQLQFGL